MSDIENLPLSRVNNYHTLLSYNKNYIHNFFCTENHNPIHENILQQKGKKSKKKKKGKINIHALIL